VELLNFRKFLEEEHKGTLHVVDIDDTLFHTTAKVRVRNSKGIIGIPSASLDYNLTNL
jgi:hypothetical protein